MFTYTPFLTWEALVEFCRANDTYNVPLFYKAPLDTHETKVAITRIYKNGKLRVEPTSTAPSFKADSDHLARFSLRFWVNQ